MSFLFALLLIASPAQAVEAVGYSPFRYAHAPIESDRWGVPKAVKGSIVQEKKNVACPQKEGGEDNLPAIDEDCLRLRVSGPKDATKAPVVVFFPGRDLRSGSGLNDNYNGNDFATEGIVFITVNHRVGPFGYLTQDGETVSRALQDQIMALGWIKDQIVGFGGDPENITLMAQGMGAYSVRQLVNAGLAGNVVKRLILLSPDSSPAKTAYNSVSTEKLKPLAAVPWQDALKALENEPLSVLPTAPFDKTIWRKISVLQTVVQGEPRERVCDAIAFATELEKETDSYLYLLHGFGEGNGSELKHLFGFSGEGERFRSVLVHFVRENKPPPSLFFFRVKPFSPAAPKAVHLHRWWQFPFSVEGC